MVLGIPGLKAGEDVKTAIDAADLKIKSSLNPPSLE